MFHNISRAFLSMEKAIRVSVSKRILLVLAVFCLPILAMAQEEEEKDLGTEVVNIVKPYTPSVSDAFKVKETPVLNDSIVTTKKKVDYSIFSVPVASTFTPAKGTAATVEKAKPIKLYDNYASLGFGNYTAILGELYSNFQISRTDNAGFFFRHNSSQGGIDNILLENKYYDTQLDGNYTSRQKDISFEIDAGAEHQLYNWYGLNDIANDFTAEEIAAIDPQQSFLSVYVSGNVGLNESIFQKVQGGVRFTSDSFSSSEIHFTASPEFLLPIADFDVKVKGDLDYLTGSFDRSYLDAGTGINYSYLNLGVTPSLLYVNNDLTLSLGASIVLGMDTEASDTDIFIYPQVYASYRLVDELLIAYGGAEGGLRQNTYYEFLSDNPFVSPTLPIAPTSQLYNAFGGLKGKLSNSVGYNIRVSYGKEDDKALFQLNPYKGRILTLEGYEYGNSFGLVYDDINTLDIFGELKIEVSEKFTMGLNANVYEYSTNNQPEAWNLPDIRASVFSNFSITEKVYGGVSLFYVGKRQEFFSSTQAGVPFEPFATVVSLDAYLDANVNVGYRVNDRLSIFAKGSNLLNDDYQKWLFYPVQGIQGLLGATYKFDWN
ncbi:TonB-dependent receptor [Aureisphaera galaxeae]|uniref:TonB-dependent receptor n=1 Tax=Aureisphaera galaxeae TaxID=1538023 RepID=UPI0023503E23|nr:TonB-dependent receptor [Aureisphaera galaxeae]MDC8004471.1 TonB-dependent receptor [Aureisphaera galaxeae]